MKGLLAGLALIAVVNAAVLAGVAWNRRGEPDATVVLTERELRIPWRVMNEEEDTGLDLQLEWNPRWSVGGSLPEGLPATTLRELGFELDSRRREPPRSAWVVLELDGEAWRSWVERRRRQVEEERRKKPDADCPPGADLVEMETSRSRLVVVDAGSDREALRHRHPDRSRYLIVPGRVEVREASPGVFQGVASELGAESVHVPLSLRSPLDEIVRETANSPSSPSQIHPPRYRATVAFGRRGEPWLVGVEKLPPPVSPPAGSASGR